MSKTYVVINAEKKVFAGYSQMSGRALWFDCGGDTSHMADLEALRHKRDARWLAQALKSDPSARWADISQEQF